MDRPAIAAQIRALEIALGRSGAPGIWREGQHEIHRKELDAALATLRTIAPHIDEISCIVEKARI